MNPRAVRATKRSANVEAAITIFGLCLGCLVDLAPSRRHSSYLHGRFLNENGGIVLRHTSIIDIFFHRSERWQVQGDNGATVTAVY
jgi:hypothetical protein